MESNLPKTLQQAILHFSDDLTCINFVASLRWENGIASCPQCESQDTSFLRTRKIWKCKGCKKQFSVKVGTIFEDSPLGLDKWLPALWMVINCKNGISSYEMARALGVTQKSAWFMNHRIRLAIQEGTFEPMSGEVEVNETYIGGLARNMHEGRRAKTITGTGGAGKWPGLTSCVICFICIAAKVLSLEVRQAVTEGSEVFTDALA